jgi:soluble lytic murein transglycosylase-like protein
MAGARDAGRLARHTFILATLVIGAVVVQPTNRDISDIGDNGPRISPLLQDDTLVNHSSEATAGDEAGPIQSTAPRQARFPAAVERWRGISRDAARTVQSVTGMQLEEDVLLALVAVESEGNPTARSAAGAIGLAQVMPRTFEDLRARYSDVLPAAPLVEPSVNVLAGALYLVHCARVLEADLADPAQLTHVLHAYNMGPRAVLEWRESGPSAQATEQHGADAPRRLPAETVEHARRILAAMGSGAI